MSKRHRALVEPAAVLAARIAKLAHGGAEAEAAQLASRLVEAEHAGDDAEVGRLCADVTADRALAVAVLMRLTQALASLADAEA